MVEWSTVFPSWGDYAFPEARWCLLLVQFYRRSFHWRQVPFSLGASEVSDRIGEPPKRPVPEPAPSGQMTPEWQAWNSRRMEAQGLYQAELQRWEGRKVTEAQTWDLEPSPSLEPFSLKPPHLQTYIPVERFESVVQRRTSLVPVVDHKQTARWDPTRKAMVSFQETTSRQMSTSQESRLLLSKGQRMVTLPDTLCLLVRSTDLLDFLTQADRTTVCLVRVKLEVEGDGVIVRKPIPGSDVILVAPGMEILDGVFTQDPLAWPLSETPDGLVLPTTQAALDAIISEGGSAKVKLAGDSGGSRSVSLVQPEWWRLANFNVALAAAQGAMSSTSFMWQPILPPEPEPSPGT